MKLKERIKAIKWDEGVELLEFCVMMPFVMTLIIFSIDIFIAMRAGQVAEYYAYAGARAAVVASQSNNDSTETRVSIAEDAAKSVVEGGLAAANFAYHAGDDNPGKGEWTQSIIVNTSSDTGEGTSTYDQGEWVKGELMTYTLTLSVPRLIGFSSSDGNTRTISSSICMMIESPLANYDASTSP